MKFTTTAKTLAMLGVASLTLAAASSRADGGYGYLSGNPNVNPWLASPAYQQANYLAAMKQRQAQLDLRQDDQMQRILGGMENGRLSMREAAGLLREHLAISALERNYLADGRLGPGELVSLEQRLAEADRHIVFESNDRDHAGQMGRPGDRDHR
jgi:hypothetical protein